MARRWVDPFSAALALRDDPGLVLLESMPGFGHLARRSFLASRPEKVATGGLDAFERAEGWQAGWLSYDLGRAIETLPELARDQFALPPVALGTYRSYLEFDHARRAVHVRGDGDAGHLLAALDSAKIGIPHHRPLRSWVSSHSRHAYESAVRRTIHYIRAGDVFQVNLAQCLSTEWSGDPFALYGRLRVTSPGPFMALVRLGGADVISASPERFLRRRGRLLETRPIKGTRPRGRTSREDRRLAAALKESEKDRAENVMIVDLARNDLGRVAEYGSVQVRRLCALERHPGVHHLVSVVESEVAAEVATADIVRACFPPGSVTGAPKIRAMEIIEELEPVRRGVYCGSVGWIDPSGDLEMSVAIRTFVASRGRLSLHVGGAIVADSDPALEWQETMHKGARLLEAAGGELHGTVSRRRPRTEAGRRQTGLVPR
jgi:para-aminobenzoate synthetase component 1